MTESMSTLQDVIISPFILPYIVAAEKAKSAGNSTVFQSPSGSAVFSPRSMYSPMSPKSPKSPQRASPQRESPKKAAPFTPSPQKRVDVSSPGILHRSVIEQSVHELHFDPELTFIASPKSSSPSPATRHGGLPTSRMLIDSPVKPVSPNRSVVPLDETEIGFSNELRASMEISNSLSTLIEEDASVSVGKVKRQRTKETDTTPAQPSTLPGPKVGKIKKVSVAETTPIVPEVESKIIVPAIASRSAKRKEPEKEEAEITPVTLPVTRSGRKKPVEDQKTAQVPEEPVEPLTKSTRRKTEINKPPEIEPVTRSTRKKPEKSITKTVREEEVSSAEPVTRSTRKRIQPLSPIKETKPLSPVKKSESAPISRKSPRFASKVVPSTTVGGSVDSLECPKCAKAYKRKDLFEKHVKSCK